jgi:hypothetical protein
MTSHIDDIIFNFELSLKERTDTIVYDNNHSTISRLISLLTVSNSNVIKQTLFHLCKFSSELNCLWRLEIALALVDHESNLRARHPPLKDTSGGWHEGSAIFENDDIGFEALDYVCFNMHKNKHIPFGCKLNAYIKLNNGVPSLKRVYLYMYDFLMDIRVSSEFKYKTLRSLLNRCLQITSDMNDDEQDNMNDDEQDNVSLLMLEYCVSSLLSFKSLHGNTLKEDNRNERYKGKEDDLKYHILTCQLGLTSRLMNGQKLKCSIIAENELVSICTDQNNATNVRADAADMLLSYGCPTSKETAKNVLENLSFDLKSSKTVYNNRENVHSETINKTALDTISIVINEVDKLSDRNAERNELMEFKESDIRQLIVKHFNLCNDDDSAIKAFNRIVYLDNALYTNHSFTLKKIMNYVWTFINVSQTVKESVEQLGKRLIEEMREMYDTCSSGYVVRFANVFTGFLKNGGVFIGWDEQILSIFYAQVNLAISTSIQRDMILENLISCDNDETTEFQKLLRTLLPTVIESIRREFKEHLSETDIDIYLRRALSTFEGHGFV